MLMWHAIKQVPYWLTCLLGFVTVFQLTMLFVNLYYGGFFGALFSAFFVMFSLGLFKHTAISVLLRLWYMDAELHSPERLQRLSFFMHYEFVSGVLKATFMPLSSAADIVGHPGFDAWATVYEARLMAGSPT